MFERHLLPELQATLTDTPVTLLTGARQVGKSTLAQAVVPPSKRFTLDDLNTQASARADPVGFVADLPDGCLLDEIQRVPELLLPIKASVDRDRRPGRFLLTGSANVLTLPQVADSLAGRLGLLHLWPLSQGELGGQREDFSAALFGEDRLEGSTPEDLIQRVLRGGYPEAVGRTSDRRRDAWFSDYLRTLIERDVRDLSRIAGLAELPRLLTLLAARTGNLLNLSDVGREAGVGNVTLSRYHDLLRALYLVDPLPAWAASVAKRMIKAPKVTFPDTGLAAYLLGVTQARLESDRTLFGALLENFVVGEVRRQLGWSQVAAQAFHFRTAGGQEVDLLLGHRDGRVAGVEVKAARTVTSGDFRGLRALQDELGSRFHRGVVLYTGEATVPFGDRLLAAPIGTLWQGSGAS